ncbi:cytochrome c [Nonlabens xiamenensis]|uniref:cytochrome c n=1 Tax=Nonlabens xiamenensis TaxID=2341043 RepID=UPI000F60DA93|nr:cytochrome c [Nonlabens xiamenensis]
MFKPFSQILTYTFSFLLFGILFVFGVIYYVVNERTPEESTTTPVAYIDHVSGPQLNEQQVAGKSLFNANCASCHNIFKRMTGPALHNIEEKYEREWLYAWIKDSKKMIDNGDPLALAIYNEYNQKSMNSFPQLDEQQIDAILVYLSTPRF